MDIEWPANQLNVIDGVCEQQVSMFATSAVPLYLFTGSPDWRDIPILIGLTRRPDIKILVIQIEKSNI